jgi:hypothetical protein
MYVGPDTVIPFASAVAAAAGFALMFWRRLVGLVRLGFSALKRKFSGTNRQQ